MMIKVSEIYRYLWAICNPLLDGMNAIQHEDYVFSFLFIKYIGNKHADDPYAPTDVPNWWHVSKHLNGLTLGHMSVGG